MAVINPPERKLAKCTSVHCAPMVNPASTTARSKVVFLAQVLENRHHTLPFLSAGARTATDMDGTLPTDL